MRILRPLLLILALAFAGGGAQAQDARKTERELQKIRRELQGVAAERRKLEGQRGDASRQLRAADEQVGASGRALRQTQAEIEADRARLAELRPRQARMRQTLRGARTELAALLRAADRQGRAGALKSLLARDRVEDAQRVLTYHAYLQRARAERIRTLTSQLAELDRVEAEIAQRQNALTAAQREQAERLAQLEKDREQRAALVAQIEQRYRDRAEREKALGRDAKSLEQLLRQLRAAAAKAERERRRLAAERAKAEKAAAAKARAAGTSTPARAARPQVAVASMPAPQVGGLGWPVSGALLAGYGRTMPDGRRSDGLLIGASAGSPVRAVADGTVVYAEWMTGYGLLAIVDHGNGYMSLYAHNDALIKDTGAAVKRGDPLGTVGTSGGQGRAALYFELRRNGAPVDPGVWLRR
jgi:septal ring factor EnvC (AmiA/AmiB activator)